MKKLKSKFQIEFKIHTYVENIYAIRYLVRESWFSFYYFIFCYPKGRKNNFETISLIFHHYLFTYAEMRYLCGSGIIHFYIGNQKTNKRKVSSICKFSRRVSAQFVYVYEIFFPNFFL